MIARVSFLALVVIVSCARTLLHAFVILSLALHMLFVLFFGCHEYADRSEMQASAACFAPSPQPLAASKRFARDSAATSMKLNMQMQTSRRSLLGSASVVAGSILLGQTAAVAPAAAKLDSRLPTPDDLLIYVGAGCFWHVQHEMIVAEQKILGRDGATYTSVAVCVYIYIYIHIYIIYIVIYTHVYVYKYICIHIHKHTYVYICICIKLHIYVCTSIYMCTYI